MTRLRLAFMGTPDFSVPALQALIGAGHDIAAVYSQPPRPAGRGQKLTPSPVHAFAEAQGIAVHTPKTLRSPEAQAEFAALGLDCAVVVAYGLILPKAILDAPRLGCVNIHASLLPRWRGAAPIQRAIQAGDSESGVTIMQMDEGLDTGPMLLRETVPITPQTTGQVLHDALSALGGRMIVTALEGLADGTLSATPQPETGVTYAAKLSKEEALIDWTKPAVELERQIRAFDPWPGSFLLHQGERLKVLAAELAGGSGPPGTLLDDHLTVACGEAALRLTRLQRPGKGAMTAEALLRGYALPKGSLLG
ncbi:MAG: methionyl-tRNA formyltransferase [Alphaproteobacteria bacterium]|nr:methionyl-tRNA formyltransferase [Alphaproteobacteria bacterium]MBU0798345.1 methionyl-tRNA formyltransferase [Alphaproteobacteria bacterium]MBU0887446.1 methionyl-tRNA formyltransferase [Alphaproteobacteria bacterium]MBU1813345.1 methionyl-tRNA formyltransferase [Alphaproteobacteria bacterium]MBU2091194.1 methionyl-tRNA formyltransferase [Alphaproteobacteria bacterium]